MDSEGKRHIREGWIRYLSQSVRDKFIWFASNDMSDYDKVADFIRAGYIPEHNRKCLIEKYKNLRSKSAVLPDKPTSLNELLRTTDFTLDGANLDYCNNFCSNTINDLVLLFKGRLNDNSLLFITLASTSRAQFVYNQFYNPALGRQDIASCIIGLGRLGGYELLELGDDINRPYSSGKLKMYSFGFRVYLLK